MHYASVWTRDAAFTALGLGHEQETAQLEVTRATLLGLVRRQAPLGQIPVAYFPGEQVWDWGETGNTDGTALFVLLAASYLRRAPDDAARTEIVRAMETAVTWLRHQDANNFGLIDSPQAADWMDSSLNRSGKVLYVNVLFHAALRELAALPELRPTRYGALADDVKHKGNILFWPEDPADFHHLLSHVDYPGGRPRFSHRASLAAYADAVHDDRAHYVAHVEFGRFVDGCDVLANCLAVLTGFADEERGRRIMDRLAKSDAVVPFPARSWVAPFEDQDPRGVRKADAERFQDARWRNPPNQYHNAAVWPFVGGYLIAALRAAGDRQSARRLLPLLAAANQVSGTEQRGFPEWINSRSGEPGGAPLQAWSAAGFLLAQRAVAAETFSLG